MILPIIMAFAMATTTLPRNGYTTDRARVKHLQQLAEMADRRVDSLAEQFVSDNDPTNRGKILLELFKASQAANEYRRRAVEQLEDMVDELEEGRKL